MEVKISNPIHKAKFLRIGLANPDLQIYEVGFVNHNMNQTFLESGLLIRIQNESMFLHIYYMIPTTLVIKQIGVVELIIEKKDGTSCERFLFIRVDEMFKKILSFVFSENCFNLKLLTLNVTCLLRTVLFLKLYTVSDTCSVRTVLKLKTVSDTCSLRTVVYLKSAHVTYSVRTVIKLA